MESKSVISPSLGPIFFPDSTTTNFILSQRGFAPAVGAATPLGRDPVASAVLVFVLSALLAEDDVAVPRLFLRLPMLPSQWFLAAQAPSSVCRWIREAA